MCMTVKSVQDISHVFVATESSHLDLLNAIAVILLIEYSLNLFNKWTLLLHKMQGPLESIGAPIIATRTFLEAVWEISQSLHLQSVLLTVLPPLSLFFSHTHTAGLNLLSQWHHWVVVPPAAAVPKKGGSPGAGARMSDLIHPDNQGPFGSPVTTATPITTFWVVGWRGQSGPVFLASIFNGQCT